MVCCACKHTDRPEHGDVITWRELKAWPAKKPATPSTERKGPAFRATYPQTLGELEDELKKIEARDVVIEIDIPQRDLRLSGEPRADNKHRTTPGVVLHFADKNGRTVTMPCDRYRHWHGNLRALFLTLEALRAVDRYGATSSGEQYAGWTALPAAGGTTATLSTSQSAEMLAKWSGDKYSASAITATVGAARDAWKIARKRSHPDSTDTGGSNEKFTWVQEAARIMAAHHGVDKL